MSEVEREARRALARLRRAVEKAGRELEGLRDAIRRAEGDDFPEEAYRAASAHVAALEAFAGEEGRRLEEKILHAGGLEPGRIRRSSST